MEHGGIEAATSKFVCFMTLTWACPKLHRFAEYVKPLERMVWVNAPSGTDSRISGRKFCHVVMKPAVAGQKSRSELGHYIQFSDETVRIHIGKAYNFWYPTHCRNPTSNEWQPVSRCFFGTVTYSYLLTSEENWVLYDTPKHDRYLFVTTGFCASHYLTTSAPPQGYALYLVDWPTSGLLWVTTNGPNHHCGTVVATGTEAEFCCSSIELLGFMWRMWPYITNGKLVGRRCTVRLKSLCQQITTCSFPLTTIFVGNLSQLRQTCERYSQPSFRPRHLIYNAMALCS